MKTKIYLYLIMSLLNFKGIAQCDFGKIFYTGDMVSCNDDPWVTVFEDDFDGNALNLSIWEIPYQGVIRDLEHKKEKQWYANEGTTPYIPITHNIEVSNGSLKIITKKENPPIVGTWTKDWSTYPPTTVTEEFNYTSANITTIKRFSYGAFGASVQIPKGKGFWPAFWLYSAPPYSELDIFEFWNERNIWNNYDPKKLSKVHRMNIHYDYDNTGGNTDIPDCSDKYTGDDFSLKSYIFSVVWNPDELFFYVDGKLVRSISQHFTMNWNPAWCYVWEGTKYYILKSFPESPMSIIFNLAIQHGEDDWGNDNEPDATTPFPSVMKVNWIRYMQKKQCEDVIINDYSQSPLSNEVYNNIVGDHVTINCNYDIQSNQQLKIIAKNSIKLMPGFIAQSGSYFTTKIDPSICTKNAINSLLINESGYSNYKVTEQDDFQTIRGNQNIKILPNPSNGYFKIEFNDKDHSHFKVLIKNILGSSVFSLNNITDHELEIDISFVPKGIYILFLIDSLSDESFSYKLIIR
jgi:beta-glucanase (GH16 family)